MSMYNNYEIDVFLHEKIST